MIVLDTLRKDKESFLFTLKNPHGVPPTRFKKTKSNTTSIEGNNFFGPLFGADRARYDINICDCCNKPNGCWIMNDGEHGYECDPTYKCSLFVNTNSVNNMNYCVILEYEVYCKQL